MRNLAFISLAFLTACFPALPPFQGEDIGEVDTTAE
jgi:hypothetical protein